MKKRVLSMFMALALCLTLLPAPAWAAEANAPEGGTIVQEEQEEATTEGNGQSTNTGGTVQFRNEHAYGDLVRKKARFHWPQL